MPHFVPKHTQRSQHPDQETQQQRATQDTSWQGVKSWYNKLVGSDGHYYHQHVVLPGTLRLLNLQPTDSLVDLGCGQGILARVIPAINKYLGLDLAPSLIAAAKQAAQQSKLPAHYTFQTQNVSRPISTAEPFFTHATIILALQNMQDAAVALRNAAAFLQPGGTLLVVLNHPCFRIPRQSGWGTDEKTKQQYRWLNRYLSPLKIPIKMYPGKSATQSQSKNQQPEVTWSFHHSLHDYSDMLSQAGFVITKIEEWTSDKESEGKAAKMENRSRSEFPLFMAIACKKEE